jgi:hypothetical protein
MYGSPSCHRRKKSLDMLVEASIDQTFNAYLSKATTMVNEHTKQLFEDAFTSGLAREKARTAIKEGLGKEVDVLLDFDTKFMRHFKEALAGAVAQLVAERSRRNLLDQLWGFEI